VHVQKVDFANREKTIAELCKYVTKSDSWANIPLEEIEKIIERPRRVRMFEALGVCRESAKKMRDDLTKARAEIRSNITDDAYLDTKEVIPRNTLKRRESWRERIKRQTLDEYKKDLDTEILDAQEWRRQHLLRMFPCAKFETLDGRRWCAIPLKDYEWTHAAPKGKPKFDDGHSHAPSGNRNASPYPLPETVPITQVKRMSNWELFNSFCSL
jgi:hypothetical protein